MTIAMTLVFLYLIYSIIYSLYQAGKYSTGWRPTKKYSNAVEAGSRIFAVLVVVLIILVLYFNL
jgi:hypothetical protein